MAGNTVGLSVGVKNAASGPLAKIRKEADDLGNTAMTSGRKLDGLGSVLKTVGKAAAIGAGLIVAGGVLAGKELLTLGTRLEQMGAKAETVFGDQLAGVKAWASANANAMGLTSREALGLAANFADLLIPMKFSREEAAKMSTDVVGLSGALAQWSGGTRTAAEVSSILAKAMLGERDSLKELGISITDADVKGRLLKNGTDKLTGSALEQAKATATQQLIFEKSTDAQAAYTKGAGTLIGKQAAATAKMRELVDTLAVGLLPVFHTVVSFIVDNVVPAIGRIVGKVQKWMAENKPLIAQLTKFAGSVLSTLVTAIGNVIGWIVKFFNKITANKPLMNFLKAVIGFIATAFDVASTAVSKVITWVGKFVNKVSSNKGTMNFLKDVGNFIGEAFKFVARWVGNVVTAVGRIGDKIRANKGMMDALKFVARAIRDAFRSLAGRLSDAWNGLKNIGNWIGNNLSRLREMVNLLRYLPGIGGTLSGLGQGRHAGGPVSAGGAFLVGEKGPELLQMGSASGNIIPNHQLGGSGGTLIIQFHSLTTPGPTEMQRIARTIGPAIERWRKGQV